MTDKEKVIGGLMQMLDHYNLMLKMEPKGKNKNHVILYHKAMVEDAIAMLTGIKDHEGVTVKPHYMNKHGKRFICGMECGNCGCEIGATFNYCPFCGLPIKWGEPE